MSQSSFDILQSRMKQLFLKIAAEKEDIAIDGVPGYSPKAQFTNGKVICEAAYVVCTLLSPEEKEEGLEQLQQIVRFTSRMPFETWGTLYAIEGVYRLKQSGLLDRAIDSEDLEILKKELDWRSFVDTENDFALIGKPTNYYGVAFGIARYRELMGWEPVRYSSILLQHLLDHISRYSGEYGFMDETLGQGRYDRYSILIPAEITELVLSTDWQEPELIEQMLDRSAHICHHMANTQGTGFSYGRSIGAYGDTAVLQILSTAVALGGILSPEEEKLAQGYCCAIVDTMIRFWYDEEMQSINMWDKGRRTDGYRNKNRILGENLSLSIQMIVAEEQWERRGLTLKQEPEDWGKLLAQQEKYHLTRFTDLPLQRSLITFRDGEYVWSLPVISGGADYIDRDPYLPVPRCNFLLEAVPDVSHGAWVPCIELKDGGLLMPAGCADETLLEGESIDHCTVSIHQKGMIFAGVRPVKQELRTEISTEYRFAPGKITRKDTLRIDPDLIPQIVCIRLQCELLSGQVQASGYDLYSEPETKGVCLDTPHGRCGRMVRYELQELPEDGVVRLEWIYQY